MDSKLQIISGKHRGRKLRLPPQARPTQNRARIALFNMLESGILNTNDKFVVWDAFAGSGAFGLECISRYSFAEVVFTDIAPTSIKTVRDNVATLGEHATIKQADAINSINDFGKSADLIFLDPPYALKAIPGILFSLIANKRLKPTSIIVCETAEAPDVFGSDDELCEKVNIKKQTRYGAACVTIMSPKEEAL
jgi:16S rRNA (guanine966-N2)-methyltransferase